MNVLSITRHLTNQQLLSALGEAIIFFIQCYSLQRYTFRIKTKINICIWVCISIWKAVWDRAILAKQH